MSLLLILLVTVGLYVLRLTFGGRIGVPDGYTIGPVTIRFYSLTLLVGVLAGYAVARRRRKEYGVPLEDLDNLIAVCVVAGLLGARIHHVLTLWDFYRQDPLSMLYIWRGGLGIYGGVAAGTIAVYIYARVRKLGFLQVADLLAPSLALGQAIGRWGNFFNQEAYGLPTELPWKLFIDAQHRLPQFADARFFHPLFLYESAWNALVFVILFAVLKKGERAGTIFGWYLLLYSMGRYLLEAIRADMTVVVGYPLNQLLALAAMATGVVLILNSRKRPAALSD